MNYLPDAISNEVIVGVVTFLIPILFSIIKSGVKPYFKKRAEAKATAKANAEKSRQETVESLVTACNKADIDQLRVLIPKLISIGERPDIYCLLDYIEKEESHRLKGIKKFLLEECKRDKDVKEIVCSSVETSPALATELADLMTKLV